LLADFRASAFDHVRCHHDVEIALGLVGMLDAEQASDQRDIAQQRNRPP